MAFCAADSATVVAVVVVVVVGQHNYYKVHQIRLVKHRAHKAPQNGFTFLST